MILNNNPTGYAEKRNFHNLKLTFAKDLFYYLNVIKHKITGIGYNPFFKGLFYYPRDQKSKVVFFNSINLGSNPWEVRFGIWNNNIVDLQLSQLMKSNIFIELKKNWSLECLFLIRILNSFE